MNWKNQERIEQNTKRYTNRHEALRALLGGIGTGNISLDASGRFCDFEIFGHPDKNFKLPYTFFTIWSQIEGQEPDARILEAAHQGICGKSLGSPAMELSGLPRFDSSTFSCRYPFMEIEFKKDEFPLKVTMEAFTPFIPLDADHSGIPGFRIVYKVTNLTDKPAQVSICGTLPNVGGLTAFNGYEFFKRDGNPRNTLIKKDGLIGIDFAVDGLADDHLTRGSLAIATDAEADNVTVKPHWLFGGWTDGAEEFWQDFSVDGMLCIVDNSNSIGSSLQAADTDRYMGSVAVRQEFEAGQTKEFSFYVAWHFPNRYGWWPEGQQVQNLKIDLKVWQNYYSALWNNAWSVCSSFHKNLNNLEGYSRDFSDALYSSTLDPDIIESLVSAITVIRSPTCFRIADGTFFGWEGCTDNGGSCLGNCTHVWNYAQALAFLFPSLERDMRRTEFLTETDETGNMAFRAMTLLEGKRWEMLPATDGQLGSILRVYREWKLSGDIEFLRELWPKVVLAMEFSLKTWDSDGDYVLDDKQHNTYDIEFYGINSLTNSILYAALNACAEMANYLGEIEYAEAWRAAAKAGAEKIDNLLWNGEYYEQGITDADLNKYRYQYGKGCLSDQLLGQELAHIYGLGYILPEQHVRSAVKSIYRYNFRKTLYNHHSVQRCYAYQDEGGLLLCSWPNGGRPKHPFVYSDEVWTGIEYQVAVHLIYEGMTAEAMEIVRTIRKRYNGYRRSPYNEVECGYHYARSMASWGLLVALSGYRYDLSAGKISFSPKVEADNFTCFYSNGKSWGVYVEQKDATGRVDSEIIALYESSKSGV